MIYSSKEANSTIYEMYEILLALKDLTIEFEEKFANKKKERNRIDFHDIEHLALKILLEKDEKRKYNSNKSSKRITRKI